MDVLISPASEKDMPAVERLAKGLDLDMEEMSWKQFKIAKKENNIIGFGRLRNYGDCTEIATLGVIPPERNKGAGTSIVKELIRIGPEEIFVTCVIPDFFSRLGFEVVKQYPSVLQKKVDFCKLYHFSDEQIFVMKMMKKESEKRRQIQNPMAERINSYRDLRVYKAAMSAAMEVFEMTKKFPAEEKYSLTDQIRRASRSVCANMGEAWRKRRYRAAFIAKLSDSETEACETQVWLEISFLCRYISKEQFQKLDKEYENIMGQIVTMIDGADKWLIK